MIYDYPPLENYKVLQRRVKHLFSLKVLPEHLRAELVARTIQLNLYYPIQVLDKLFKSEHE